MTKSRACRGRLQTRKIRQRRVGIIAVAMRQNNAKIQSVLAGYSVQFKHKRNSGQGGSRLYQLSPEVTYRTVLGAGMADDRAVWGRAAVASDDSPRRMTNRPSQTGNLMPVGIDTLLTVPRKRLGK